MSAGELLDAEYSEFGNERRRVLLPVHSRSGARAGIGMLGASRITTLAAEALGMAAVTVAGTGVLRGPRHRLGDMVDAELFTAVWEQVEGEIGRVEAVAFLRRAQASRPGWSVLAVRGGKVCAYVRAQPDRVSPDQVNRVREADVLRHLTAYGPRLFGVPATLGAGATSGWEWLATAPLSSTFHRADGRVDPVALGDEISDALGDVLGAPPRAGWRPMHGDLVPWNVRRSRRARVVLDWEEVGFGPRYADATYLTAVRAVLRESKVKGSLDPEACRFWAERVSARDADADASLRNGLMTLLTAFFS